jgi:DNA-binding NarL/FixJ family response regulator
VIDGIAHREGAAQKNWASALQTYRTALSTYRRFLEMRTQSAPRPAHMLIDVPPALHPAPAAHRSRLDGLTPREREVAELVARGYSNRQIAETLVLTRGTVANHVGHILAKVCAANRTQLAVCVFGRAPADEGAQVARTT